MPIRRRVDRAAHRASEREPVLAWGSGAAPLQIAPADYEAFERLLGEIQDAWSNEDVARLHTLATPEMVSYFNRDLEANRARNVVTRLSAPSFCRAISLKPGAKVKPTLPAWRCDTPSSIKRSIAATADWSKAAGSRWRSRKSGLSCGPAAPIGSCRRSSRPDRPAGEIKCRALRSFATPFLDSDRHFGILRRNNVTQHGLMSEQRWRRRPK